MWIGQGKYTTPGNFRFVQQTFNITVHFFGGFERAIPPIGSDEQVGSQNQNRKHYVPVLVVWANNDLGVTLFLADIVIELKVS